MRTIAKNDLAAALGSRRAWRDEQPTDVLALDRSRRGVRGERRPRGRGPRVRLADRSVSDARRLPPVRRRAARAPRLGRSATRDRYVPPRGRRSPRSGHRPSLARVRAAARRRLRRRVHARSSPRSTSPDRRSLRRRDGRLRTRRRHDRDRVPRARRQSRSRRESARKARARRGHRALAAVHPVLGDRRERRRPPRPRFEGRPLVVRAQGPRVGRRALRRHHDRLWSRVLRDPRRPRRPGPTTSACTTTPRARWATAWA